MDNEAIDEVQSVNRLADIHWLRLRSTFQAKKNSSIMKGHAVSVFQAIVKAVSSKIPAFSSLEKEDLPIFHIVNQNHTFKMTKGQAITVDFLFPRKDTHAVSQWAEGLSIYLNTPPNNRTLELIEPGEVEKRNHHTLAREFDNIPQSGELCLEFLMPLPFKREPGKSRVHISKENFINIFEKRISTLFSKKIKYKSKHRHFQLLPHFLKYTQIKHESKSLPGTTQLIRGVIGKLYLKGNWKEFLPFLILGSELHIGSKFSNSQGYYRIHPTLQSFFTEKFPQKDKILQVLDNILDRYDPAYISLPKDKNHPFNSNNFAESIYNELKDESYNPTPAFPTGQMTLKDLVVCQYLRKVLYKHTGFFEDWNQIKEIKKEKLIDCINDFFPNSDKHITTLLGKTVTANFMDRNPSQSQNQVINMKNPLTPCLAGIYYQNREKCKTNKRTSLIIKKAGISLSLYGDWLEINHSTAPQGNMYIDEISEIEVPGNCKISANVLKACQERDIELRTRLGNGYTTTIIEATKK